MPVWPQDFVNKIHCADCLEFMKQMPDKCVDLVLTDPPYGINADNGTGGFGTSKARHYEDSWDNNTPSQEVFNEILRISKNAIIFGGNFFTDKLPANGHWIVWDKTGDYNFDNPFSKCELAWTNIPRKSIAKYVCIQQGFISEEKERFHPTQKPINLFEWIIRDYSREGDLICDCFLGSGTTVIACKRSKRNFIGIEISGKYCEVARLRMANEMTLFEQTNEKEPLPNSLPLAPQC